MVEFIHAGTPAWPTQHGQLLAGQMQNFINYNACSIVIILWMSLMLRQHFGLIMLLLRGCNRCELWELNRLCASFEPVTG